ncbi:MAG: hypothetical protein BGN88_15350 [Clostridiales bacterium 43-6]|nr:MAG: hypothetical protein BGN88_15350 [Clostridiales bacterium 43-6]
MQIIGRTDTGKIRSVNEDCFATGELPGGAVFAIICDGMGGANGGSVASNTAVKIITDQLANSYRLGMNSVSVQRMLQTAAFAANITIYDMAKSIKTLEGMGTTLVIVLVIEDIAYIAHAGDSRVYLIQDKTPEQLTRDHSVVQHMMEMGELTKEEAMNHPRRNVITRALGVNETVEVEYTEIELSTDDIVLLCTDGLTNYVSETDMLEVFTHNKFEDLCDKLIENANENGGGDNITVVILLKQ